MMLFLFRLAHRVTGVIAITALLTACSNKNETPSDDVTLGAGFNKARSFSDDVQSIAKATDGSGDYYIGGQFVSYNKSVANGLVRINSDGSFDDGFMVGEGFNRAVLDIVPANDGSGDIYVGGLFSSFNGKAVNSLVRLNSDGSLDSGFDTQTGGGFNNNVFSIALASDGSGDVYIGGLFTSYRGATVNRLVRLNSDGSIDSGFDTVTNGGFNFEVLSIIPSNDSSGDVYVGGWFTSYKGTTVNRLVRLNSDGSIDSGFDTVTGGGFNSAVQSLSLDVSGAVYVGGQFTKYNGTTINSLVRLNNDGSRDNGFDIQTGDGFNGSVGSVVFVNDGSGDIYVGGFFTNYKGVPVNNLLRLNSDGSVDSGFDTMAGGGLNNGVTSIVFTNDGSGDVYAGGFFTRYRGTGANRMVRISSDGSIASDFASLTGSGFNYYVESIIPADDESEDVYVGGYFTSYDGSGVNYVVRLNRDGSRDGSFDTLTGGGFNDRVQSIALANDNSGDIYVGGFFTDYKGTAIHRLVRLNNDGSRDNNFMIGGGFNNTVNTIAPASDDSGDIYVGGLFTSYNGNSAIKYIVRLNSDGSIDNGFNTIAGSGFNNAVDRIVSANDSSGDVYVGGYFTSYNNITVNRLARLNSDGSLDSGFNTGGGFNGIVGSIAPATDGSGDIYVGSGSTNINGTGFNYLVRLNSDGSIDSGFDTMTGGGFNSVVQSIAPANDGSGDVYVGGWFTSYNNIKVSRLIRLQPDGNIANSFDSLIGKGFNNSVESIAPLMNGSGDVYVGGWFTSYNGTTVDAMVRLELDGTIN